MYVLRVDEVGFPGGLFDQQESLYTDPAEDYVLLRMSDGEEHIPLAG